MTQTLTVDLGDRSYPIHIGSGLLSQAAELIPIDFAGRQVYILADINVRSFAEEVHCALEPHAERVQKLVVDGGEQAKSQKQLEIVLEWMMTNRVDRGSVLIAVGGGVIGDLGGFAASIILRGIDYVQVPTTLLAQVDSSVGGKTGINTPQGKNLVGSFYQPKAVLCDVETLKTLPERELKAGYAEIVKYGLIDRPEFFEWLETYGKDVLALEPKALTDAIETSCKAKAVIVAADEREAGKRALLNLGHTFAHALEAAAGYDGRLLHGEAVSIGLICAFALSSKMGLCSEEDLSRVRAHLQECGLKISLSDFDPQIEEDVERLYDLMLGDKKMDRGVLKFILTKGIGQAFVSSDVQQEDVIEVLKAV